MDLVEQDGSLDQRIYLSLGANLGDRFANLSTAVSRLLAGGARLDGSSSIFETEPVGWGHQPNYLNICVTGLTAMTPLQFLGLAKKIEQDLGRVAAFRNGPRPIDIDLLLYGDQHFNSKELTIPHPRMIERTFVLVPLAELAPEVLHPILGMTVRALCNRLEVTKGVSWWGRPII